MEIVNWFESGGGNGWSNGKRLREIRQSIIKIKEDKEKSTKQGWQNQKYWGKGREKFKS